MNKKGDSGEEQAVRFLKKQKVKIIKRNFHCCYGEIDIIAKENDVVCFIEVRARSHDYFGSPQETVDRTKQKKIIKTAQYYLQTLSNQKDIVCRFDVIAILSDQPLEWFKNAFA